MKSYKYGFAIVGYNNEIGMKRLLESLDKVIIPDDDYLTLIFCLDKSDNNKIKQIAEKYEWKHGPKIVFQHQTRVGLRDNILYCGNMMNSYDLDAIAVFEDDIYMSPVTYKYMTKSLEFYADDENIAGISLYKHEFNINANHPFYEYNDGGDSFFIQYAMSWGQIWLRNSWNEFYKWYQEKKYRELDLKYVPQNLLSWQNSWLKYHILYCIDKNKYFVYPRVSLTTNFSDPGQHNKAINTSMQVPINWETSNWKFNKFNETYAVYDAFFENTSLKCLLGLECLEVDLYGIKKYMPATRYVLTRRRLPNKVIKSWGLRFRPIEANIIKNIPGNELYLYDLSEKAKRVRGSTMCYIDYDLKGINMINFRGFIFLLYMFFKRLFLKFRR